MSLLNRQSFTIKREVITATDSGGSTKSYTTAGRGALPTTWKATEAPLRPSERYEYFMRDIKIEGNLYGTVDPQVDERDVIVNPAGETLHVIEVRNPQKLGKLYIVGFERFTGGPK